MNLIIIIWIIINGYRHIKERISIKLRTKLVDEENGFLKK